MQIVSSSDVRNNFAAMLDKAQHEPVTIQKQGRNAAVLISYEEFERLTDAHKQAFQVICDDVGARAAARGLTEAKLIEILSGND
ncbi:MAG: type II toxin-antitoxin system Phd/YefM family antitoxin [Rickettsiales bacterium]